MSFGIGVVLSGCLQNATGQGWVRRGRRELAFFAWIGRADYAPIRQIDSPIRQFPGFRYGKPNTEESLGWATWERTIDQDDVQGVTLSRTNNSTGLAGRVKDTTDGVIDRDEL